VINDVDDVLLISR